LQRFKIKKDYKYDAAEKFLRCNFSSPTHWTDWNVLVSKYYDSHFYYYLAIENNKVVGICPVHEFKNGILENIYSGQFHYIPYGGWLSGNNLMINNFPLKYYQSVALFSFPDIFSQIFINGDEKYKTLIVDLNKSEKEIWMEDINSKRRNMIRKAVKSGVRIEIITNKCGEEFYEFYKLANSYNKLENLSYEFFQEFNESKNIRISYIWSFLKDKILGINVIVSDKDYSIYWLGLSDKESQNLGQGELMQWEAIRLSKNLGCRYYDLCYIEKERLPHIYEFKKGFSKCEVAVPFIFKRPLSYKILNKIKFCF
jgi:hypothetical protein